MSLELPLRGKVAIVTGASGGIGREIALALGRAGATVGLIARRQDALEKTAVQIVEAGGRAAVAAADVGQIDQVRAAVASIEAELGGADVLVNNAGGARFMAPLLDIEPRGWDKVMDLNLKAPYLLAQAVVPA